MPTAAVSFTPCELEVNLGGETFTIPAFAADTWISVLAELDGGNIIPGMLSEADQGRFCDLLFQGAFDVGEVKDVIYDIITTVSGHSWWWTLNLLHSALYGAHSVRICGEMAQFDAKEMPFSLWLAALYALLVREMKEDDKMKLDADLSKPPPGVQVHISEQDEWQSEQSFLAMLNN